MDDRTTRSLKLKLKKESREIVFEVEEDMALIDILREADLPIDGVLIFDGNRPVPLDSFVKDLSVLTIINVSSGG